MTRSPELARKLRRAAAWALFLALFSIATTARTAKCGTTSAGERDTNSNDARAISLDDFDANIEVTPIGAIEVTETLQIHFRGSWQGFSRFIRLESHEELGGSALELDVRSVTDEKGTRLRFESSEQGGNLTVKAWVSNAEDTHKTVVIRYRATNALHFLDEHDELYWNVTGNGWKEPIAKAHATVLLPDGVRDVRARVYTGTEGSREQHADIEARDRQVAFYRREPLAPHEGMTIRVAWAKGLVARPGLWQRAVSFGRTWWPLSIPLGVAWTLFCIAVAWDGVRRPRVVLRSEPPPGLTPAEIGALFDDEIDMRDVTATLVDLAIRGCIRIQIVPPSRNGKRDFAFRVVKPQSEWSSLRAHERNVLEALFTKGRPAIRLSEVGRRFFKRIADMKRGMFVTLMKDGYYARHPHKVRKAFLALSISLGVVSLVLVALHWLWALDTWLWAAAIASSAVLTAIFASIVPTRTPAGNNAYDALMGFRQYLVQAEKDRRRQETPAPRAYERLLPYAIALQVEKAWARSFEATIASAPDWFDFLDESDRHSDWFEEMRQMTSDCRSSLSAGEAKWIAAESREGGDGGSSSWGSSADSGSSDGGSSGGGSGGGGGDGF